MTRLKQYLVGGALVASLALPGVARAWDITESAKSLGKMVFSAPVQLIVGAADLAKRTVTGEPFVILTNGADKIRNIPVKVVDEGYNAVMGKNSGRTVDDPGYWNEVIQKNPAARLTANTAATFGAGYGIAALGANSYDTMVQAGVWAGSSALGLTAIDELSK